MSLKRSSAVSILLIFCLSAIMMLRQLMSSGYFSGVIQDAFEYTSWAWQFIEALKEGIIYPRWTSLKFWGYGSPVFVLYPPLAFYLIAFFNIFTDSVIAAMNIAKFTALFLSGTGMFFLIKEFYSEKIALLVASFYVLFPYNIFGLYYLGAFASAISLMWFAPLILFTYKFFENRQYKYIIYAGICYGGLILTHLVNAYMFSFVLISFTIYMSVAKKRPEGLIVIPFTIIIGFLISSAYLIPLIYEKQFVNLEAITGEGFYFADFFILPNITNKFSFGSFWPVYYNTFLFFIFFFCILLLLFLHQILKLHRVKTMEDINTINKFFMGTAVGSMFLLFGVSTFIWENIPFFRYISFPYRWLSITTFATVILSAAVFCVIENIYRVKRGHNKLFIASLFLLCFLLDYRYISSANVFTEEKLISGKAVIWITTEYLPVWVDREKIDSDDLGERVLITRGEGKAEIIKWKSAERTIEITAYKPLTVRIRTFNFPGWKAYIDSVQTEIKTEKGVGAMLVDIPEGEHTLELRFVDTPIRYYSKLISLASLFIVALFLLRPQRTGGKLTRDRNFFLWPASFLW